MAKKITRSQPIKFDGVSFNSQFLKRFRSEESFLKHMKNPAYAHIFKGENREAKLRELYAIVRPES
jgi:hypothetical protein